MKVIITGGAGFIGSHLILRWIERRPNDIILNFDKLTYAADLQNLKPISSHRNYHFFQGDICDLKTVRKIVLDFNPDGVIHLAAESHVDNSIHDPTAFMLTNVLGTFNLLNECRLLWGENQKKISEKKFLHVSTDEVYGTLGESGFFSENSLVTPRSPYAASKAGADHLVSSFFHTYGMNVTITHCSNNFGPHQNDEKLIPTIIRSALANRPIPIYGTGTNIRDWLYVKDHCDALEKIFDGSKSGEVYNIGGRNEWKNIDLAIKICDLLKAPKSLITLVKDRQGHDFRYSINPDKIEKDLGWQPSKDFEANLKTTVDWFARKYKQ